MFLKHRYQYFFTRRIAHTVNLKRERRITLISRSLAAVFLGALLIFVAVYSFQGGATTAVLYPSACSGTWVQPANAQGKPDLDFNAAPDAFTPNNSAFVVRDSTDQKQIFCSNFSGDPLLASSSPQLVTLRLSWAIGEANHTIHQTATSGIVQQVIQFAPSQQVLNQIASSSASNSDTSSSASSSALSAPAAAVSQSGDNGASATSSSSTDVNRQTSSSASSSSASAAQPAQNLPQPTASTTPLPSVPAASDASTSNTSSAPATESAATPATQSASTPANQPAPAPASTSAPAATSSSTSFLWKLFSPFFARAFADQVSTTPLLDATASTPVLIPAPAASSSPSVSASSSQSSTATTLSISQSASTSVSSATDTVSAPAQSQPLAASSTVDTTTAPASTASSSDVNAQTSVSPVASSTSGGTETSSFSVAPSPALLPDASSSVSSTPDVSSTVSSGTLDPTSNPNPDATSTPAVPMFEIRYSLDGSTWDVLADVTKDQMGQAFVVPVSSNDDIGKLQIAVVTLDLSPLSLDQAVYLDGMTLQVTYPAEQKKDANHLVSDRMQLTSGGGAFTSGELQDNDFSRHGAGTISCSVDPFSQTISVNGTAHYAIHLSGPSDAQFDFAGVYGTLLNSPALSSPTNTRSSIATSVPDLSGATDTATTSAASGAVGAPDASNTPDLSVASDTTITNASSVSGTAALVAGALTGSISSTPNDSTALLSRLMPFLITLGDYPQGITPALSQDASGTPLVSFFADKTALPGSYTLIVRALAKYHGQLEKGLCQLNLIVK